MLSFPTFDQILLFVKGSLSFSLHPYILQWKELFINDKKDIIGVECVLSYMALLSLIIFNF